jgi:uncharacterized Zn-binding protein involved in type VI secretion
VTGDYLQHVGIMALCPHGAPISVISTNIRVKVMGQPVAVLGDTYTVGGCPFQIPIAVGTKPQPCLTVQWATAATRVKVMGRPALLKSSTGLCLSPEQIPQGPPGVQITQMRVKGM